jgi:A/G-specific adenine glycosylase
LDELRALPGIGRYTVGAIASMVFGMDEPTLDGNLRRVFARVFNVTEPADSPAGEKILWGLAARHLPKGEAGDYNQALMDLGATICLPRNPRCLLCPLMKICRARIAGTQEQRPVLKPKKETPHYVYAAAVVGRIGPSTTLRTSNPTYVLLAKRPSTGLLANMWEFPNGRVDGDPARRLVKALKNGYGLKVQRKEALGIVQHGYTHFSVTVHAFRCEPLSVPQSERLKWVAVSELEDYPMGKIDRQIARMVGDV